MVETRFKHTEIGIIPEDWEAKVFTDLFTFLSTASYSRADMDNHSHTGYIHYGDIHTKIGYHLDTDKYVSGYISDDKLKSYSVLKQGDLIIADASEDYSGVGKGFEVINVPSFPVISGLHTFLLREIGEKFALGFKAYFHSNPIIKKQYDTLATGLKVYSLSKSIFNKIYIPIPTLSEQKAITETLTHTDEWIDSLKRLITKKRLIKQGAVQKLLTPKKDWVVMKLGDAADIVGGGTPSTFDSDLWNGDINWFTPTEVGEKKYLRDSKRKITLLGLQKSSATILPIGSILLTTRAGIGDLGILTIPSATNQGFQSLVVRKDISNEFIYYLLCTLKGELLNNASGSTFLEISPNKLKAIEINMPPPSEQVSIATILSDMDSEIEALEQKLEKAKKIKQGMMHQLLTGRIRLV